MVRKGWGEGVISCTEREQKAGREEMVGGFLVVEDVRGCMGTYIGLNRCAVAEPPRTVFGLPSVISRFAS